MRVVFDECLFYQKMNVVRGEFEGATLLDLLSEYSSDTFGDTSDKLAIYFSENFFLLTGEK